MFRTSYLHEVRKEKYERTDVTDEEPEESSSVSATQSLQGLNSRFSQYINRARVLEQRNAVFRKQLEALQRLEETSGWEDAFTEQIRVNRQHIRELSSEHAELEQELKDACCLLDELTDKYKNECDYQEGLRSTLEELNQEADNALLRNLEYQIQSQFLQDDINFISDRQKKNLAEIQTYVDVLHQIHQTIPPILDGSVGISEVQRTVPELQSQLEEYKSTLCQLQAQKQRLQTETMMLEQTFKNTEDRYDSEIQMYNEKIESLRKELEEAERSLEKFICECRHLATHQTSLKNELENYKRIIENEGSRLNSAILGTPISMFSANCHYTHTPTTSSGMRDITHALQDITSIKPRQKNLAKRILKKKEQSTNDANGSGLDGRRGGAHGEGQEEERKVTLSEKVDKERVKKQDQRPVLSGMSPQDVPDGAQISRAFDTLRNIVRDRMRRYRRPEPPADFYTKGRYVLVSGDSSYSDPCFYTSTPSGGHVYVTIRDGMVAPYQPYGHTTPSPPPPPPMGDQKSLDPTLPINGGGKQGNKGARDKETGGKNKHKSEEIPSKESRHTPPIMDPSFDSKDPTPSLPSGTSSSSSFSTSTSSGGLNGAPLSYEKVKMMESVEKFTKGPDMKRYEETSMVVETTIEKSRKKKQ